MSAEIRRVVRQLLADREWTQGDLADKSGIRRTDINLILNGRKPLGKKRLEMIAGAFGLTVAEVLSMADSARPSQILAELAAIRAQLAGAVEDRKRNDALMEERLQKALADPLARLAEVARDLAALVNGLREGDDGPPQAQQTHRPA